jgi:hypothetical protein
VGAAEEESDVSDQRGLMQVIPPHHTFAGGSWRPGPSTLGSPELPFEDQDIVIEDLASPIEAFRFFRAARGPEQPYPLRFDLPPRLVSVSFRYDWPTSAEGGAVAQCHCQGGDRHLVPGPSRLDGMPRSLGYGCGLYAVRELPPTTRSIWGGIFAARVLLGGRVREHLAGYRAQYATVTGLYRWLYSSLDVGDVRRFLDNACELYDVPLLELPADRLVRAPFPEEVV